MSDTPLSEAGMAAKQEAQGTANFLASLPGGNTTVERPVLRALMLDTGGQIMARGALYEIVAKHLGAGVYRVTLKRWSS